MQVVTGAVTSSIKQLLFTLIYGQLDTPFAHVKTLVITGRETAG